MQFAHFVSLRFLNGPICTTSGPCHMTEIEQKHHISCVLLFCQVTGPHHCRGPESYAVKLRDARQSRQWLSQRLSQCAHVSRPRRARTLAPRFTQRSCESRSYDASRASHVLIASCPCKKRSAGQPKRMESWVPGNSPQRVNSGGMGRKRRRGCGKSSRLQSPPEDLLRMRKPG